MKILYDARDEYEREPVDQLLTYAGSLARAERNEIRRFYQFSVFDKMFRSKFRRIVPVLRIFIQLVIVEYHARTLGNEMT